MYCVEDMGEFETLQEVIDALLENGNLFDFDEWIDDNHSASYVFDLLTTKHKQNVIEMLEAEYYEDLYNYVEHNLDDWGISYIETDEEE